MSTERDPLTELQRQIASSREQVHSALNTLPSWLAQITSAIENIRRQSPLIVQAINKGVENFKQVIHNIELVETNWKLVDEAGWLLHYTTPLQLFRHSGDALSLSRLVENHYRDNWHTVRWQFLEQLDVHIVDDEAKNAYREGLAAHEHGLYRATCRTVIPEIERVIRIELHHGAEKQLWEYAKSLSECAKNIPLKEYGPHSVFAFKLYRKLVSHLYLSVKVSKPDEFKKALNDPVPNRHAIAHGLISYSSFQNSINALIMVDYIFHVVSSVKRNPAIADGPKPLILPSTWSHAAEPPRVAAR